MGLEKAVETQSFLFYIFRTQVTRKYVKLIFRKIPGWEISENNLKARENYIALYENQMVYLNLFLRRK